MKEELKKLKAKEYMKKYYLGHKDKFVKKKDRELNETQLSKKKEAYLRYASSPRGRLKKYRQEAKRHNRSFSLTFDEFKTLISSPCHYCGETGRPGIDRIDSSKGYTLDNCLPACFKCNKFKRLKTYESFLDLCAHASKIHHHLTNS